VKIIIAITIGRGDRVMMKMMVDTSNHMPNMDSEPRFRLSTRIGQIHKF
jgi:hypothetical protein